MLLAYSRFDAKIGAERLIERTPEIGGSQGPAGEAVAQKTSKRGKFTPSGGKYHSFLLSQSHEHEHSVAVEIDAEDLEVAHSALGCCVFGIELGYEDART